MFQNKSLFRMLLIKKNVRGTFFSWAWKWKSEFMSGGHFFHEPENRKASFCPGDIDSWAWKPKSEFLSGGHFFHEPENRKASLCPGDIDSRAWNRFIYSQPIQLVIQRTVPRIILTTRIIKQNSSTNHSPFNRYKIGRINNKAKRPKMNRMVFSLFLFSYYTLIL